MKILDNYTGAMGGGIAILVLTDQAATSDDFVQQALDELKKKYAPFDNALFRRIYYGINMQGIVCK